ncbi:GspH/FimT family pseudopilin [Stenotrophomonas rhizophila]|uniref:Type II secretion system protein H n=1 Tax=Stenotrophomonas rhizophila TaxID=216778 RepID=A0AAW5PIF0_9GAMM|nr:Tfp pilus assembly protein FimT/FimU [Stenotrophomonas rhizophila]MCS4279498.1 type IV fimbrial biogenesis protein FimT [Stenotrophomonas rhizophila]
MLTGGRTFIVCVINAGERFMSLRRSNGFTLIELMVTIAVLAILITLGMPSFQGVLRSNRAATTTNELMASLALARSEALKNTRGAGVCASSDGSACNGDSWGAGWMVWSDADGSGTFDAEEPVLRYSAGSPRMLGSEDNLTVAFDGRGRNRAATALDITLKPDECGDQPLQRTLRLSAIGQVRVERESCK